MENLIVALNAVLPMFLMIGVGCLACMRKMISDSAVRQANSLCFRVFMSIMLFHNVYSSDLRTALNWPLIIFCCAGVLAEFCIGMLLIPRLEQSLPARGVMLQAFFRTNVVLLAIRMADMRRYFKLTIYPATAVPLLAMAVCYVPFVVDMPWWQSALLALAGAAASIAAMPRAVLRDISLKIASRLHHA